jgi:hypothetical protein
VLERMRRAGVTVLDCVAAGDDGGGREQVSRDQGTGRAVIRFGRPVAWFGDE